MSLILEALNKAEQNNRAPSSGTVPPAYPLEKKSTNKSLLLILIATACITSAIVTLLVIYTMESDKGASQVQTQAAREPASAVTKELAEPQPAHQTASRKTMAAQAAIDETPGAGFSKQSAPGFGHLISQRSRSDKTTTATHEPSTIKTAAPTQAIATASSDTQADQERAKAQERSEIKNLQLADMRISVHMYSKTPAKRFVYINSTRYSENSLISDGIFLDEITENGIILNVNGTRYRMPIKL
ncbi:MAG: general secretion pathway protein GspB [Candidatus Polarisedimenticolaceae bacterium]|nr:general secretion pathway protein GspB [Candidatus Polarisedimenticolaceae bacterium]